MITRIISKALQRQAATPASRRLTHNMSTGLRSFPAWFVRSGTSNGLVIRRDSLPSDEAEWYGILPAAMGSGDAEHGRQLDGMGSGTSSTAKIVVLAPGKDGHDVEYTIVQAGVRDNVLDQAGNCGNMTAVVGPAAWDMGYVSEERKQQIITEQANREQGWATVRTFNTNTSKTIDLHFRIAGTPPTYCPEGSYSIAGVAGTHSPITMSFLDPAGAKTGKMLPTGNKIDTLKLKDGTLIEASLVDVGNPGVFIRATDVGFAESGAGLDPASVEADPNLKTKLEEIRQAGAVAMGMDPSMGSVPKVVMVYPATQQQVNDKDTGADICCLAMSMGQAHKAAPLTLALCLGAAAQIPGTLPASMLSEDSRGRDVVRIAHPSGRLDVSTRRRGEVIEAAQLLRTARVMMKGDVYY